MAAPDFDAPGQEPDDGQALAELRAAWRTLGPEDPTVRVDAPDADTRATLDWLRAAWQATVAEAPSAPAGAPPLVLPWHLRRLVARRRLLPLVPWLAAAGLLVALLREATAPRAVSEPSRGDLVVDASSSAAPPAVPDVIPLTAVDARRMEMRHGPVRLILVLPNSTESPREAEPGSAKELR